MKIEILLLIPFFYGIYEVIGVIKGLENKKYIYGDKEHSIEHFVYLIAYFITISLFMLYLHSRDEIILNYFIFMLTFSSIALIRHIQKERLNKNKLWKKKNIK